MQQFIGIRLLQLELSDESDLEGQGCDLQLFPFIFLQILCLDVALHSQGNEILNRIGYQPRQQVLLKYIHQRSSLSIHIFAEVIGEEIDVLRVTALKGGVLSDCDVPEVENFLVADVGEFGEVVV